MDISLPPFNDTVLARTYTTTPGPDHFSFSELLSSGQASNLSKFDFIEDAAAHNGAECAPPLAFSLLALFNKYQ